MLRQIQVKFLLLSMFIIFCCPVISESRMELLDGDLIIHGKLSQQVLMTTKNQKERYGDPYDYDFFNFRTTLKLEALWHAYRGDNLQISAYSVWKNFYDMAHDIDSGYNNTLKKYSGNRGKKELRSYNTFRDICRELYVQFNHNLFNFRIGKQIVAWGETGFERMTDLVNPVDLRGMLNPAYPDFAEIKRGRWMARLYVTPQNMPADLTFELLVVPDFVPNRLWPVGYHNTRPWAFNAFQNANDQFLAYYRDVPKTWGSPDIGFRIRGFTLGFDWTLLYLHHRSPDALIRTGKAVDSVWPALTGVGRAKHVYTYEWMDTIGATFNRPVNVKVPIIPGTTLAMSGNVLSFEGIVQLSKKANQIKGGNVRITSYDRYAFVVGWDTKIFLPWITPKLRNKHLTSSTQVFMEWIPSRSRTDAIFPWVSYRTKGHHWNMITQMFSYELWHGRIIPAVYAAYNTTQGSYYYAPAIAFKPTFGWTILARYINYQEFSKQIDRLDSLTFEITYEF